MRTREQVATELQKNANGVYYSATSIHEPQISRRPEAGQWSIKEILCHLVDIQQLGLARIEKIVAEDNPQIEFYEEEKENAERDHRQDDMQQYLAVFLLGRVFILATLNKGGDSIWQRRGQHPVRRDFTIEFILNDMLDHERKHFEQIRELVLRTSS
jgi:uncharacterized damage-inducible protein DinB